MTPAPGRVRDRAPCRAACPRAHRRRRTPGRCVLAADWLVSLTVGRVDPTVFDSDAWNIGYHHPFWFYGQPVVYLRSCPCSRASARCGPSSPTPVLLLQGHRRLPAGLRPRLSKSVRRDRVFATGQVTDAYCSLTPIALPTTVRWSGPPGRSPCRCPSCCPHPFPASRGRERVRARVRDACVGGHRPPREAVVDG